MGVVEGLRGQGRISFIGAPIKLKNGSGLGPGTAIALQNVFKYIIMKPISVLIVFKFMCPCYSPGPQL